MIHKHTQIHIGFVCHCCSSGWSCIEEFCTSLTQVVFLQLTFLRRHFVCWLYQQCETQRLGSSHPWFFSSQGFSSDSPRFVLFFICFLLQIVQLILSCFSDQQSRLNQVWIAMTNSPPALFDVCLILQVIFFFPFISLEPMSSWRSLIPLQVLFLLVQWVKKKLDSVHRLPLDFWDFSNQISHLSAL